VDADEPQAATPEAMTTTAREVRPIRRELVLFMARCPFPSRVVAASEEASPGGSAMHDAVVEPVPRTDSTGT
jgi:hypothetical protein